MKLLLLGATGLVGRNVLEQALAHSSVTQVMAPTRKTLPERDRLINPVALHIHELLPEMWNWKPDAVINATGTTIKKVGSREAFRIVDYDLPLSFAQAAYKEGAQNYALVSAIGASLTSPIAYARIKAELERDVQKIGFKSLTILRPSMIGGEREEFRLGESIFLWLSRVLAPVLPKGSHVNPATVIARVLVDAAVTGEPGVHFRFSDSVTE
jgi:uncharacterized protein YbjT (DUF2867 family)